jgi:hypothetical protein
MGAVLFGRNVPKRAWLGALGGFLPDVPMLSIVATLKISGVPDATIFGELYWQNWWQVTNGVAHSFLLWGGMLAVCLTMRRRQAIWELGAIFAGAALLHSSIDFLCHRDDAHMQFWPITRWKFVSPVSYWDGNHYGRYFNILETLLGLLMAGLLFRDYRNLPACALLVLAMLMYLALPAYFIFF